LGLGSANGPGRIGLVKSFMSSLKIVMRIKKLLTDFPDIKTSCNNYLIITLIFVNYCIP
jgi:hypothetical protein